MIPAGRWQRAVYRGLYQSWISRKLLRESRPYRCWWWLARLVYLGLIRPAGMVATQTGEDLRGSGSLCCLLTADTRGWILEGICRELVRYWPGQARLYDFEATMPLADHYFIPHYSQLKPLLVSRPWLMDGRIYTWYTHPREIGISEHELVFWLNHSTRVLVMNRRERERLIDMGVDADRVCVTIGGADPAQFSGHERRADGLVGFCSAYYERKNPELILAIVRAMPHRRFILLGKGWRYWPDFGTLLALPNFDYMEGMEYSDYPDFYRRLSVFVSPSLLEGGPIPLLEAMMENVVPVASDTGFAPDLIRHGSNGYLFNIDTPLAEVCACIDAAYDNPTDIRATVLSHSWQNFVRDIHALDAH